MPEHRQQQDMITSQPQRDAYALLCNCADTKSARVPRVLWRVIRNNQLRSMQHCRMGTGMSDVQGKYLSPNGGPKEARLNKYKGRYGEAESRYGPRPNVTAAVQAYATLAKETGVCPTALALRS